MTKEPQSAQSCSVGGWDGRGQAARQSTWALVREVRILLENPDGVDQGRLPAEVVPEVNL